MTVHRDPPRPKRSGPAAAQEVGAAVAQSVAPSLRPRHDHVGSTSCGRWLPVLIAIQFSFNDGRSRSTWQGFSTQWYCCTEGSVFEDPSLLLVAEEQPHPRRGDGARRDAAGRRCWRWA